MKLVIFKWWHPIINSYRIGDEDYSQLVHHDDLELLINSNVKSDIFAIKNEMPNYFEIEQLNLTIRVKETCLIKIEFENLFLGDNVEILKKNDNCLIGKISRLKYNYKYNIINYFLMAPGNRKIKKRYTSLDLRKVENVIR